MTDLKNIRARITTLTLAAGLPQSVWSELCLIDSDLSVLCAAQAADEERVLNVVRGVAGEEIPYSMRDGTSIVAMRIATRAAKQLAGAGMTQERRRIGSILYEEFCDVLGDDQAARIERCVDRLLATVRP